MMSTAVRTTLWRVTKACRTMGTLVALVLSAETMLRQVAVSHAAAATTVSKKDRRVIMLLSADPMSSDDATSMKKIILCPSEKCSTRARSSDTTLPSEVYAEKSRQVRNSARRLVLRLLRGEGPKND